MTIRLPEINGTTEAEQLLQIRRYLTELAQELQQELSDGTSNGKENYGRKETGSRPHGAR